MWCAAPAAGPTKFCEPLTEAYARFEPVVVVVVVVVVGVVGVVGVVDVVGVVGVVLVVVVARISEYIMLPIQKLL